MLERMSPCGAPPGGWYLNPGDPGLIGVLSDGTRRRLGLPDSWQVRCLGPPIAPTWERAPLNAIIVDLRNDKPAELALHLTYLARTAQRPLPPIGLLPAPRATPPDLLHPWLSLPNVRVLEADGRSFARQVHEAGSMSLLEWVAGRLIDLYPDSPLLSVVLRRVLLEPVPSEAEACERSASGIAVPYQRTVEALSTAGGWSASYLRRHLPLAPSVLLRNCTLLRGIMLYARGVTPWTAVARRLGFCDSPAWTHFCRRLIGVPPRGIAQRPRSHWIATLFGIGVRASDPCQLSLFA